MVAAASVEVYHVHAEFFCGFNMLSCKLFCRYHSVAGPKAPADCRQQENAYYKQAYEGFIDAIASENFPICGMDEHTVNYLVASMAYKLGHMDVASKLVSAILVSRTAGRTVKDRAYDLKEQIIEKLHE